MTSPQTPESRAEVILELLRGYMRRSTWVPDDRAVIASILREWADEVEALEARVSQLELDLRDTQESLRIAGTCINRGFTFATYRHRPTER